MVLASPVRRTGEIAAEVVALLGTSTQVSPFSSRYAGFGLAEAYGVVAEVCAMRRARGEVPIGRKIGFTNRAVWGGYGISGPIWNFVFDTTVHDLAAVGGTFTIGAHPEPRIEPELVLHLAGAPDGGMDDDALMRCIDWIAPGFEIVHSIFPGWRFSAADAAAACGVHLALLLGNRCSVADDRAAWAEAISNFGVTLTNDAGAHATGHAANVLGGPLAALRFLVQELAAIPGSEPLRPGELVTTGTLTEAMPAIPGEAWTAAFAGIDLAPIRVAFT